MKWTNKGNFPEPIVKAITNSKYSKGNADFSVTELISPPQIKKLQKMHSHELEKDVSENIWMLLGTGVHAVLEEAIGTPTNRTLMHCQTQLTDIFEILQSFEDGSIQQKTPPNEQIRDVLRREAPIANSPIEAEHRASMNLAGYIISGAVDVYDTEELSIEDYKTIGVWKFMHGDFDDYAKQLNMYRYIFAENGRPSKKLKVIAILKDWKSSESAYKEGYPDYAIQTIDVDMWEPLDTLQYMLDRVKLHSAADKVKGSDELAEKFPCSDEERWGKRSFAIMKKGGKKASKVFDTRPEALEYFGTLKNAIEYEIQERSSFKRCEEYCDVSQFCMQYGDGRPKLIIGDDLEKEPVIPPISEDAKKVVNLSIAEMMKANLKKDKAIETPVEIIPEKESTEELSARHKEATQSAVDKVNEEHGYDAKSNDVEKKNTEIDISDSLDSILGKVGL